MDIEKEIIKVIDKKKEKVFDHIVVEKQLNIYLNKNLVFRIMCLPTDIKFLIYGFFFSNGYISEPSEIKELKIIGNNCFIETKKEIKNKVLTIASSCFSSFFHIEDLFNFGEKGYVDIEKFDVVKIMKEFQDMCQVYKKTGGVHSAAMFDGEDIQFFSEDIGRHNAVDKVIGKLILHKCTTDNKVLLTSGRISSEIVFKAKKAGFSAIISFSSPTSLAVEVAEKFKIVLIGFARGKRYNVYTGGG